MVTVQAQLAGNFVRSCRVDVDGGLFLCVAAFGAIAAVDVDDVHGFRVFDDEIRSALVGNGAPEQRFDLFRDGKVVKNREFACVLLHNVLASGSD